MEILQPNIQTRLNDSERTKGVFLAAVSAAAGIALLGVDKDLASPLPEILQGRAYDILGGAFYNASFRIITGKTNFIHGLAAGIFYPASYEISQAVKPSIDEVFDPGDFAAAAIGSASIGTLDLAARALYNSGLTRPIYRALGIYDSRDK